MPSFFETTAAANASSLTDPMGDVITYTPFWSAPLPLAVLWCGEAPRDYPATPRSKDLIIRISVRRTDLAGVNIGGDFFTLANGDKYRVTKILNPQDPAFWPLEAVKELGP